MLEHHVYCDLQLPGTFLIPHTNRDQSISKFHSTEVYSEPCQTSEV